MISLAALRAGIAAVLADAELGLPVYPRGVDGPVELPAVAIGQPEADFNTGPCDTDTITLPLAVAVAHDGISEASTQQKLEDLWMQVAQVLRGALDQYPLAEIGIARTITSAEPGDWILQGAPHPAYVIRLTIHG